MDVQFEIEAEVRGDMGKGASRRLRRDGKVPAIIYGAGKDPVALTLDHNDLLKHIQHEAFFSHVLTVNVGGKAEQAVLKDMQRHPARPIVMHVDFLRVSATDKIRMHVPLHFMGEEMAPGVKIGGGVITHNITDVEVACLPKNLPEFIEVDISGMELNQSLHLSDLKLPAGVELVELSHGPEHDLPVVAIHATRGGAAAGEGEGAAEAEGE